jgi:hypothetical protein
MTNEGRLLRLNPSPGTLKQPASPLQAFKVQRSEGDHDDSYRMWTILYDLLRFRNRSQAGTPHFGAKSKLIAT